MRTLAIVPARNEAGSIAAVLDDLRAHCPQCDVLVVDDGSSDRTAALAEAGGALVISLPFNLGIGGAVQTGFLYAARHGYDCALQFDGDGQHVAAEVGKIVEPLRRGDADVVIGSRYLAPGSSYRTPLGRRLGMLVFQLTNSRIVGRRITDNTSGFRAYGRRAIEFLAEHYPDDYPEPEAVVLLGRNGCTLAEVPVLMAARSAGLSSIAGWRGPYYMVKVLLTVLMNAMRAKVSADR